ncbi:MAG: flagellar hook-length control protein FliK [Sulfuritalea sp.]|nr:flagellar hook-length control protein FliK [Sulfuritalea sp.]
MQNLSLPITQVTPLKKVENNMAEMNLAKAKAPMPEKNSSFQMMLSKQVQAKQTSGRTATVHQAESNVTTQKTKAKANDIQHGNETAVQNADGGEKSADVARTSDAQAMLDSLSLLNISGDAETQAENSNTTIGAQDLVAPALLPVVNVAVPLNAQSNAVVSDKAATDNLVESDDIQSENSRQLETLLSGTAKASADTETSLTNLMKNDVKESALKEPSIKEVMLPTNLQATAPVNVATPIQQAGAASYIQASPGKTGWDQAISQKVVWMVGTEQQTATLTLNPPDLGPLQVVINVHNDQADTTFISDNAEVRQALQDGMDNLRNKMSESGVQLGQANVSSGQQAQQQFQQAMQNRQAAQVNRNQATSGQGSVDDARTLVRVSNGLVDTFA